MTAYAQLSFGALLLQMALYVLVGIPMVGYLWDTLNHLLALEGRATQVLIAVPVLLVFIGLMVVLARQVRRWEERVLG